MRKGASVPFFILVIFALLIQFNMTTQTKKSPGRPKKAQAPAQAVAPATPAKKKRSIKRKEQVLQHKEYEIIKGGGIVYMLPQKGVTIYDSDSDSVREIRYCPNEQSIFRDQQSENAKRESVAFREGRIFVPKEKPNLRKFLELHPQNKANGGTVFREVNKKKDAEMELQKEFLTTDAVALVRDKDINDLLPIAMYFNININTPVSEIRYNLLRIAKTKPQEFIQAFDSPHVQARSLVVQSKNYQIINVKSNGVYWFDSNSLIVSVPVGQDPVDVMVRFCLTEKGASVLSALEERLDKLA
jgi:hypothetical protein|tara:strand:+ start:455 stop:1354 length:900 start_codon:yes stop_codon:yes gene_type:complete